MGRALSLLLGLLGWMVVMVRIVLTGMMLVAFGAQPASAAGVVEGGKCAVGSVSQISGTRYVCTLNDGAAVWTVQASSVRFNGGCSRRGEVAAFGSTLFSCAASGSSLRWKRASTGCRSMYVSYVASLAEFRAVASQVVEIERLSKSLPEGETAGINAQLEKVRSTVADIQKLMKVAQSKVTTSCRT